jgi:hypothetical protein
MHLEKRVLHSRTVDAGVVPGEARQKKQKTQQFVRGALASKSWCILRMHCVKWVLHLRAVDAGAAREKNTKKTTICQKYPEANLRIKSMVHPEGAL